MALTMKDLIAGQKRLAEQEAASKAPSMSMDQLRQMTKGAGGGNVADSNLLKIFNELKKHTSLLQNTVKLLAQQAKIATREDSLEAQRVTDAQTSLLQKIEENTRKPEAVESKEPLQYDGPGLGTAALAIAAAIAGVVAAIKTQLKTIQLFAKALTPEKWIAAINKSVASIAAGLSMEFDLFKASIVEKLKAVETFISDVFGKMKMLVKNVFGGEGKVVSAVRSIVEYVSRFVKVLSEPFVELFKYAKGALKIFDPIMDAVKGAMGFISKFGSAVGFFTKIFSKFLVPLNVILTLWDTVKGAIEGFEKDGIVGAIAGAVEGLFNSLIFAPLDMLKDATAWILDKFGFENAAEFLDSFSFQEIFTSFVEAILHPVDTLKEMFSGLVSWFEEFEIPKIGFTIPVINKEVSIGPFYPFKSEASKSGSAAAKPSQSSGSVITSDGKNATAASTTPITQTTSVKGAGVSQTLAPPGQAAPAGSREEYDAVYKENLKKTGGNEKVARKLTAAQVGLQPGASPDTLPSKTSTDPNIKIDKDLASMEAETASLNKQAATTRAESVKPVPPTSANAIYQQSANNAEAASAPTVQSSPVVVSAPTTNVNNNQTSIMRIPSKNNDPTLQDYYRSRYA